MDIGQTIRQARLRAGLTQQDVAEAFNISRAAVNAWEKKGARPSIDRLVILAKLLEIPLSDLLGAQTPPGVAEPAGDYAQAEELGPFYALMQAYAALDARDRASLLEIAKGLAKAADTRKKP